ncbi:hypothetical protein D3C71_1317360 [compost metagenome]
MDEVKKMEDLLRKCLEEAGYEIPKQSYADYGDYSGYVGFTVPLKDRLQGNRSVLVSIKWG